MTKREKVKMYQGYIPDQMFFDLQYELEAKGILDCTINDMDEYHEIFIDYLTETINETYLDNIINQILLERL